MSLLNSQSKPSLLPPLQFCGKVTQARLLRLLIFYLILVILGSSFIFFAPQNALQIWGLGLIFPGGGFIVDYEAYGIIYFLGTLLLFIMGLAIWFGTGNILAPPSVWLSSAFIAATTVQTRVTNTEILIFYASFCSFLVLIIITLQMRWFIAQRQRSLDNAYLLQQQAQIARIFTPPVTHNAAEMSVSDLQRLRFALDRALQPVNEFNGFENLDQFQTAALRYQINFLAYGIALTQARFTPAFAGYLNKAQINLLDKQAQHRVWSYWYWENCWGNLQRNPEPLCQENIMYTGFVALQMVLFKASSGCEDFKPAGRFQLSHPSGKTYFYNDLSLIENLAHGLQTADFGLMACEPNWVYPLCNTIGACALLAYEAQTQSVKWQPYQQKLRDSLETEFLDNFGRYIPCRSARTGLALPAIGGIMPLAMPCFFLNALAPDLAMRQWLLLRRQLFDKQGKFCTSAFWRMDTGNYSFSRASAYTATALAAAELGDNEVYQHCMQALESECPTVLKGGVIHRQHASVWAHGVEIAANAVRQNSFRELLLQPNKAIGLRLDGVKYPDILVASAQSDTQSLTAILYAGIKDGNYEVGLSGLEPQKRYQVTGAFNREIVANMQGQVRFMLPLVGRTLLSVRSVI